MKIDMSLSRDSVTNAIRKLKDYKQNMEMDLEHVVEILTNDGADVARSAYAEWDVTTVANTSGMTGKISVDGDMPLIAEFGAGNATLTGGFENTPAEARPGSYSEEHAQQYSTMGYWFFGGTQYYEVPPHSGLLKAKQHIVENSTDVVREVLGS